MKDNMIQVKAVLLDLDGTIFDITERDAFARYQALNDLGCKVSLDDVRKHYRHGIGSMGILHELGIELTEKQEKEYIQASFDHFTNRENALRLTRINRDAYNVLSTLSKKYRLMLITSRNALSSTEEELEWFNIKTFFTQIITREVAAKHYGEENIPLLPFEEQRAKLYKCAIELANLEPQEMLCIGDAVGEIQPARALGIKILGVLTGFSSREEMESASIDTVNSLSELAEILT